jgi:uncharacterized membrane protein YhhN
MEILLLLLLLVLLVAVLVVALVVLPQLTTQLTIPVEAVAVVDAELLVMVALAALATL